MAAGCCGARARWEQLVVLFPPLGKQAHAAANEKSRGFTAQGISEMHSSARLARTV
jgi:hypothetical protein